jgi:Glycosyl hydrolase family 20, domain 2
MTRPLTALVLLACGGGLHAAGPGLDLTRAVVVVPPNLSGPERMAARMLVDEVAKRSWVSWETAAAPPADGRPAIVLAPAREAGVGREGYRIATDGAVVSVAGADARGVLYGVGRLLRELRIEREKVTLPDRFAVTSAPRTPLRGHQLGYRPKTNSYDGWNVAEWEQYIRDLAVFGCNAIELIPPRSDDAADSPHFPLPPLRMMTEMSRLANDYGMDVWVWYPALDRDYADPQTVEFALNEWGQVFKALPRLDAVFVPGGDPGHTKPSVLFALLERQAANLRKYHPKAQMWMSPQSFDRAWLDEFFALMKQEPAWLAGIAYGPQVRLDLPAVRAALPARYPIRDYPDITHSRHCQYPVPDWDVAFALSQGREVSNPRPVQMAHIFRRSRPHTIGFITYSEGCHDDVNKIVWSALGWDEQADVRQVLREYGRYFIGPAFEEAFADGLLGLEQNWIGPALANQRTDATLLLFGGLEKSATPAVKRNWRFQQALYRAYYDAYVRARLRHETAAEREARAWLGNAKSVGALRAVAEAEAVLDRAARQSAAPDSRARLCELAEALFQSIHAQLSVPKYQAIAIERGATLDGIDVPLTDAGWLWRELAAVRLLPDESARLARINAILNRTDPGPGGFYDALGDPARRPHLARGQGWEADPAFYATPLTGFGFRGAGPDPTWPRAWWHHAESLYDAPLQLRYTGLDPKAAYRVRVVYGRERRTSKVGLVANDQTEIHGFLGRPYEPLEFDIPAAATASGTLTLTWTQEPGAGGTGRGCQVAEVWLLRVGG